MKKVIVEINGILFTPKDPSLFDGFHWGNFIKGDNVFIDALHWRVKDCCGVFVGQNDDNVRINFKPIVADDLNDMLHMLKCVGFEKFRYGDFDNPKM